MLLTKADKKPYVPGRMALGWLIGLVAERKARIILVRGRPCYEGRRNRVVATHRPRAGLTVSLVADVGNTLPNP